MRSYPTLTLHIYLTLDKKFGKRVSELSGKIAKKYSSNFEVGKNYLPHITLYLFSAPRRNKNKMIEMMEHLSSFFHAATFTAGELVLSKDGWLMIEITDKKELLKFHKKTVALFNDLREGILRSKYRAPGVLDNISPLERKSLLKYGDKHAMTLFNPHISIAEFSDMDHAKRAHNEYVNHFYGEKFTIEKIVLISGSQLETGGIGKILYNRKLK